MTIPGYRIMTHRDPVHSSNIQEIGHDQTGLQVQFKNGAIWHYPTVDAASHDKLMGADSIGSYFAKNIKPFHSGVKLQEGEK